MRSNKKNFEEFSKIMIMRYSQACIIWITASYLLAAFGRQMNETVTVAVITSLAAVLLSYFFKSLKENLSKNSKQGDLSDKEESE